MLLYETGFYESVEWYWSFMWKWNKTAGNKIRPASPRAKGRVQQWLTPMMFSSLSLFNTHGKFLARAVDYKTVSASGVKTEVTEFTQLYDKVTK